MAEENFEDWASEIGLNNASIEKLEASAMADLKALKVVDLDEIPKLKLLMGQKAILTAAVKRLQGGTTPVSIVNSNSVPIVDSNSVSAGVNSQNRPGTHNDSNDMSALDIEELKADPKVKEMLRRLPAGTFPLVDRLEGKSDDGNSDDCIYLFPKVQPKYHDITDFINVTSENLEEEIISASNKAEVIYRPLQGTNKIQLKNVTVANWNSANAQILYALLREGSLSHENLGNYLNYTVKINDHLKLYDWQSILLYDREYRKLQAGRHFQWGSEPLHLGRSHLIPKMLIKHAESMAAKIKSNPRTGQQHPANKAICRNYNKQSGCHFRNCRFAHVCNVSGCGKDHPQPSHPSS